MVNNDIQQFLESKKQLQDLFKETKAIADRYEKPKDDKPDSDSDSKNRVVSKRERLDNSEKRLERESFKVLIVGEFKRGKSTFINALLGEKVLPAYSKPCTATINEVSYGEEEVKIIFVDPLPENKKVIDNLPEDVQEHIRQCKKSGKPCEPMIIKKESIDKYVTIPENDIAANLGPSVLESPYERVELTWPLKMLDTNKVTIIDSPGLNENATRSAVTEKYYSKVDAVIFVVNCTELGSGSEITELDYLKNNGLNDIFFICNMYDRLLQNVEDNHEDEPEEQEKEINDVKKRARDMFHDKTNLSKTSFDYIHFISAQKALKARQKFKDDPDEQNKILKQWGFSQMENALFSFLGSYRGKIKLQTPGNELKEYIRYLITGPLPDRLKMYEQRYETLEANFNKSLPDIQQEENRRNLILDKASALQKEFCSDVKESFHDFMDRQIEMIPVWIRNHEFKNSLTMFTMESSSKQIDRIGKECIKVVEQQMEDQLEKWKSGDLKRGFDEFINNVKNKTAQDIKDFYTGLDNIKQNLNISVQSQSEEIGTLERVIAATGGFFVGGIGSAMVGGSLGLNDMLKSLLPQIGLAAGMILVGITNPLILLPALFASGSLQTWFSMNEQAEKIKAKIAGELQSQLRIELSKQSDAISKKVKEKTDELIQMINNGLSNEINSLQENVKSALKEMKDKKSEMESDKNLVKTDIAKLEALEKKLLEIDFLQQ